MSEKDEKENRNLMMRYAGLGTTWLVSLGAAVYVGYQLDKWLKWGFPLFIILSPVVMLVGLFWQLFKEFGNNKK